MESDNNTQLNMFSPFLCNLGVRVPGCVLARVWRRVHIFCTVQAAFKRLGTT